MTASPDPRPAALVEAMAKAICNDTSEWAMWAVDYADDPEPFLAYAEAALKAVADQGLVLIPRAELEEAAEALSHATGIYGAGDALANRLRQRSRG